MYNVNKNINSEGSNVSFLDVGIHENVLLTNVEYKLSPEGNEFMVFTFDKEGKAVTHTEWRPKDQDLDKLENKTANQIKRVKHIVTKFIPDELYEFEAKSFKEFCEKTILMLGEKYKGKLVRMKVIYNYSNYTALPNYVPFIETMDITADKSKLSILSIDKMTKDRADQESFARTNPFDTTPVTNPGGALTENTPTTTPSDLPF
jgi:hypothetical protein